MSLKITFVTNMCSHYSIRLFELLSEEYSLDFLFTGGQEKYWDKKNQRWLGKFNGYYLKGFYIFPKIRIVPALLKLIFKENDIFIKTIDDRLALPFIFLLAKIRQKPFILWTQQWMHPKTFFHKISYLFMKYIYTHSDAIIVYGKHVRDYLISLGVSNDRIFYAPQSIDNSLFNKLVSSEEKKILKNKIGLGQEKIILYVGRMEKCKGLDYLIEALALIKEIDFLILFIGSGSHKDIYEEKCKSSGVKCLFLDHISNKELYQYYSIADIFSLPSITTKDFKEPWGAVINEAMNQGCPIVATDAVGAAVAGLVESGHNGFIVREKNSKDLRGAIKKLLLDEPLRLRMSEHSREKVKDWTNENMVKGFINAVEYAQQKGLKRESRRCHA